MIKRITYTIVVLVVTSGLIFTSYNFGLFSKYNFFTAQRDIKNGSIQIIIFGELPLNRAKLDSLAEANGFNFFYEGCLISNDEYKGSKYYNKVMVDYLEKIHGQGWWTNFQMKSESLSE
jgi:hypothetical protein